MGQAWRDGISASYLTRTMSAGFADTGEGKSRSNHPLMADTVALEHSVAPARQRGAAVRHGVADV